MSESQPSLWYKDVIIYEVHVRAFHDSNGDGIGDFKGLIEKLDYIKDLGVTAIWLLPFYPSPLKDDGYDIADYFGVHSNYGSLKDFKKFVREAHKRGLRVITELVVNHTSDQHPWFQAARRAKDNSARRNFYVWSDTDEQFSETRIIFKDTETSNWAWDSVAGKYYWHRFFSHQPDLNLNNPKVVEAVSDVLRYWLDMGVDGLRLDAVPYLCVREGTNNENLPETHDVIREFRRVIDEQFEDRMLLAEANQWPTDVMPYFGNGDECHMAFHFPVMPRLFIALHKEDRQPIIDILRRTPTIPDICQWALFLRNHDELTLEMVTEDERDYMYKAYAEDQRMRLNLGIRRRLAPLLGNDRRTVEVMNSILFSFPGTPVIYYGDEIGMGDNIYLGDRDGVRTPMQWSIDRNAGFSKADPAKLFLPVVMDPVYGYQSVNVEAQERNPGSLLNFMKRMIALRRQFKAFGRGTLEFLEPKNNKILAYVRKFHHEVILCVVNLSRTVQAVELDLSEYRDWIPVEMTGRTEFPPIGELPYFVTLGPHSFYWFILEPKRQELIALQHKLEAEDHPLPLMVLQDDWESLWDYSNRQILENEVIPQYLTRCDWFAEDARLGVEAIRITDYVKLGPHFFLVVVHVLFGDESIVLYTLPLRMTMLSDAKDWIDTHTECLLAHLKLPFGEAVLYDAIYDETACSILMYSVENNRILSSQDGGCFMSHNVGPISQLTGPKFTIVSVEEHEQTTSIHFRNGLTLKLFRKMELAPSPDTEMRQYLREDDRFTNILSVVGMMNYEPPEGNLYSVVLVHEAKPSYTKSTWQVTVENIRLFYTRAKNMPLDEATLPQVATPGKEALPPQMESLLGPFAHWVSRLGYLVGEYHCALAQETNNPAFASQPLSQAYLDALSESISRRFVDTMDEVHHRWEHLTSQEQHHYQDVMGASSNILETVRALPDLTHKAQRIRCHGNLSLHNILWADERFIMEDFEGDPAMKVEDRRKKGSPMYDVASILCSLEMASEAARFQYREESVLTQLQWNTMTVWASRWRYWVGFQFLHSYLKTVQGQSFIPAKRSDQRLLLSTFVYEITLMQLRQAMNQEDEHHIQLCLHRLSQGHVEKMMGFEPSQENGRES